MIILTLVAAAICISLAYMASTRWRLKMTNHKLPPGPRDMPLLTSLAQLSPGGAYHSKLAHWAQKYGKMYLLHLAGKPMVVVNDATLMRDLLGRMTATGRKEKEQISMVTWSGRYGIFHAEGNEWVEQKQFLVRTLVQFGFDNMEPLVIAEADKLCTWIKINGRVNRNKLFLEHGVVQIVGNLMWTMLTGQTADSMQLPKIFQLIDEWMTLPPNIYRRATGLCKAIQDYVTFHFAKHRMSRVDGEPPRDIIDAYIVKVENCRDPTSTFYGEAGWKNSFSNMIFLLAAGADTTGNIVKWILFYLSVHVEVQEELQREIDDVIGMYRAPSISDKNRMPYLEAVIVEALRFSSLVPSGGTIMLLEDITFGSYRLPKGTQIFSNRHFVHNDKKIWGDPENFRPERFLEEGSENLKNFVIAFHVGKRSCPGAFLARDIIFLVVAKLFQTFTFSTDPDVKNVEDYLEPIVSPVRRPKDLALVVRNRED